MIHELINATSCFRLVKKIDTQLKAEVNEAFLQLLFVHDPSFFFARSRFSFDKNSRGNPLVMCHCKPSSYT